MTLLQGSSVQPELRIVIIGRAGVLKNKVLKSLLNCEKLTGVKDGLCTLHQCEQAGRRISVVEAPGWDRVPENVKEEVDRSVSLCPPGPHVFLVVIPVKISEEPSLSEIVAAETHVELLSERVWKHTIFLFACDEGVSDFIIQSYLQKAKKILDKCEGRAYVLESRSEISELFTKIEDLVEENRGDVFIPQSLWCRRGSLEKNPPNMTKDKLVFMAFLLMFIIFVMMITIFGSSVPENQLVAVGVGAALTSIILVVFLVVVVLKRNRIKKIF